MAHGDSTAGTTAHIDEDTLERYAMNQLPESTAAPIEEHLLVCPGCRDRLAEFDRMLVSLRDALEPPE